MSAATTPDELLAKPTSQPEAIEGLGARLLVDTSEGKPVHLLVARNGAYIRLTSSAYSLLVRISEGATFESIATDINQARSDSRIVTAAELEAGYQKIVDRIGAIEASSREPKGAFWFRRRLVSERAVRWMAKRASSLYHPFVSAVCVALVVVGAVLAARAGLRIDATHFWAGYGLFLLSLLAHELGHASACARFGAQPGEIGFTMYLVYPAFFSDVSAAWALRRFQRVVVDLGGVYFQCIVGALYAIAHSIHPWEPLRVSLLLIVGSCIFSLNPILKFDGYWVVADALGVTNLSAQPGRILRHAGERLRGRPTKSLPWPKATTALLVVYTATTLGFWIFFLARLVPFVLAHASRYGSTVAEFGGTLVSAPRSMTWATAKEFVTSTYLLLFAALMLGRLVAAILPKRKRDEGGSAPPRIVS